MRVLAAQAGAEAVKQSEQIDDGLVVRRSEECRQECLSPWLPSATGGNGFEAGGFEVDAHLEVDGDTSFAVFEFFDAENLADVFAVHRIVRRRVRKSDEDAHAGIVGVEAGDKVQAVAGSVDADGNVFEMVVARLRGTDADGPGDLGAAAAAVVGEVFLWFVGHGSAGDRMNFGSCDWQ